MGLPFLFLDFDGVICDSIDECFVSSWYAFFSEAADLPISVKLSAHKQFVGYRPFIRRGADYLLLQHCIDDEVFLEHQSDFDKQEQLSGVGIMDMYHQQFYMAREHFLKTDEAYWLSLNRIYPGLRSHLPAVANEAWILTTKEADFAFRIVYSQGISWNRQKIICTGKNRKLDFIKDIMGSDSDARGIFIDDQIDHFKENKDSRVTCLLAEWGYVKPEWLNGAAKTISLLSLINLLQSPKPDCV